MAESALAGKTALTNERLNVKASFTQQGRSPLKEALARPTGHVALRIEGIEFEKAPEDYYEVYLNPPPGRLDYKNPHYVGNLSFFGLVGHPDQPPPKFVVLDLTRTLKALQKAGQLDMQTMTFRFVRRGTIPPASKREEPKPGVRATFTRIAVVSY